MPAAKVKISELAERLGLKEKALKDKIIDLGFELGPKEKTIEKDIADLVESEIESEAQIMEDDDTAEVYDELVSQEIEREIIKSQRKKTAGKKNIKSNTEEEVKNVTESLKGKEVEIPEVISVKEFSEKLDLSVAKVIGELMKNGILANLNQQIDYDTAQIIANEFGAKLKKIHTAGDIEDVMSGNIEKLLAEDEPASLKKRPPVISVMGHVDHGKTKLLDYIRDADVVSTESGGITQHIGAYQVVKNGQKITFLDTPGHEAFTSMRARGAKATDIAILVVASDEGVKPQTIEAINHAKEANIPIIVAINKMDKPNANPEKVKGELVEHGLQPEDWGGQTIMAPVSAMTGQGIPELLDMVLLVAEMQDLKANPNRPAVGTVIEAILDPNLGPVATILINAGILKIGDNVVVGRAYGRIKTMIDHTGKRLKKVSSSDAARISGLSTVPMSGDILQVCANEKTAKEQALMVDTLLKADQWKNRGMGMEEIISQIHKGRLKNLKIVLKADTKGSLEAIRQSLAKIKDDRVAIKIIHAGIGAITEGDVMMASASKGIVFGFHVEENVHVSRLAERENVDIM
ncbi:translation initiation factor IF-2, partial [Patescibacteria group bacterium]|nr:translation initiation factor IF-2 [Patescibacteria group bacterium]